VSNAAVLPMVVVAAPQMPFNSMQELIALARQKPGELSYATSGHAGSTHLAGAMLENFTGTKMINVPFKGNGPALAEVMAGRVTFMFYPAVGIADQVAAKRLKVIAVGTKEPWADFPGVPTLEEMGLRGFDATAPWVGLLAPAGTPPAIVNRVSAEMRKSLAKPETLARMKQLGAITVADSPAAFASFLKKDHERWAQVIKTSGIRAE
jgi:tripartite-type tricarboxylate transporter receptor subunit TctC